MTLVFFDGSYAPGRKYARWAVLALPDGGRSIVRRGEIMAGGSYEAERHALRQAKHLVERLPGPATILGDHLGLIEAQQDTPRVRFAWVPSEQNRAHSLAVMAPPVPESAVPA